MLVLVVVNVRNFGLSREVLDVHEAGIAYHHRIAFGWNVATLRASYEGCGHRTNQWHGRYDPSLGRVSQDPTRPRCREQPIQPRAAVDHGNRLVAWSGI